MRWYCRSVDAPKPETAINLWHSLRCWVTGATPPWLEEWQEWQAEQAEEEAEHSTLATTDYTSKGAAASSWQPHGTDATVDDYVDSGSVASSHHTISTDASAAALRRSKRMLTAFGLGGIYVTWTIFAWFIFTYGSLIYQLLGPAQQDDFARGWGVSYGAQAPRSASAVRLFTHAPRRHGRRCGVEGDSEGGGQGPHNPCHPGAAAPHPARQLAGGPRCVWRPSMCSIRLTDRALQLTITPFRRCCFRTNTCRSGSRRACSSRTARASPTELKRCVTQRLYTPRACTLPTVTRSSSTSLC